MPRGRKPDGEVPLSNAERQARFRACHQTPVPPAVTRTRRPIDRRPRPRRWHDAVDELLALQAAYAAWYEALPDTLQGTATDLNAYVIQPADTINREGPSTSSISCGLCGKLTHQCKI
jgi:hypothetical protein